MAATRRREGRPVGREALILGGYLLLALAYTGLWTRIGLTFLAGEDPVQDVWVLRTITRNMLHVAGSLFDGNLFYPAYKSVLFVDPLLGPSLIVLPLRVLTDNPVLLYNVALLSSLTLASYGFYRLGLALSTDRCAALLAGIAVPYTAQQMHHLQLGHLALLSIAGFAFLWLGLVQLLDRPRLGAALLTGLAFAWQAGTDGYYAVCCVLLCLLIAAWGWRSFQAPRMWSFSLLAAAIGLVPIIPYMRGFLELKAVADMTRGLDWSLDYSTDLASSPFRSNSLLWQGLLAGPDPSRGGGLFPGIGVLAFAALGLRGRDRTRFLLILVLLFFFLLSLGPELRVAGVSRAPLPFKLLRDYVPFFESMRHPITLAVVSVMALGLLAVRGLARTGLSGRPRALAALLLAVVAETLPAMPRRQDRGTRLPDAYGFLASQPPGAILELPFEGAYSYMWWAARHDMPLVNGQLAFEPRWYGQLYRLITREWARRPAHQDMEDWASVRFLKAQIPLRYLVLHAGGSGYVVSNVEATTRTFELIRATADGDRVYRVRRGGSGPWLRRRFRDDQLGSRRVVADVRSPSAVVVRASMNECRLDEQRLSPEWRRFEWSFEPACLVRGLNVFSLDAGLSPEATLEVADVEPGG